MFDLLGYALEALVDVVGDMFDGAVDAGADAAADTALSAPDALLTPGLEVLPQVPAESLGTGGGSVLAATDFGISPERFDPPPVMGAYNPFNQ